MNRGYLYTGLLVALLLWVAGNHGYLRTAFIPNLLMCFFCAVDIILCVGSSLNEANVLVQVLIECYAQPEM